jgi:hypothetical protein
MKYCVVFFLLIAGFLWAEPSVTGSGTITYTTGLGSSAAFSYSVPAGPVTLSGDINVSAADVSASTPKVAAAFDLKPVTLTAAVSSLLELDVDASLAPLSLSLDSDYTPGGAYALDADATLSNDWFAPTVGFTWDGAFVFDAALSKGGAFLPGLALDISGTLTPALAYSVTVDTGYTIAIGDASVKPYLVATYDGALAWNGGVKLTPVAGWYVKADYTSVGALTLSTCIEF